MNASLFSGYDIRGAADTQLTKDVAWNIGKAFCDWLPTTGSVGIVCHSDASTSLCSAIVEGIRLQGREVMYVGTGTKDMIMTQISISGLSGGVYVGIDELEHVATIELFTDNAQLIDSDSGLLAIKELVEAGNFVPSVVKGGYVRLDSANNELN